MNVYQCQRCPLAFEVGYDVFWGLSGGWAWYVCSHCGTMHRIDHLVDGQDHLYAFEGPIRALVEEKIMMPDGQEFSHWQLPFESDSWRLIKALPTATRWVGENFIIPKRMEAVALDQIGCAHCGKVGGLRGGMKERFGEICPVCQGPLEFVYSFNS